MHPKWDINSQWEICKQMKYLDSLYNKDFHWNILTQSLYKDSFCCGFVQVFYQTDSFKWAHRWHFSAVVLRWWH